MAAIKNFEITEIVNFIKEYDQEMAKNHIKNAVLFLGETGKGKSCLTEFLTGNPSLYSQGSSGAYVIVDTAGRISKPQNTILSRTTFPYPVLLGDADKETCYLDCPGFRDTRSTNMDILSTIYMKKTLKNYHMAKIVFVLTYEDVRIGGHRPAFLNLVKHASEFISNLDKFANSIALFVTKVPCTMERIGKNLQHVPYQRLIQNVVEYLESVESTIEISKSENSIPNEKKRVYENALKLIKILIGKNRLNLPIGIFRSPDQKGPIQKMEIMQKSRQALNDIINNALEYSEINENDFGYSISPESKLHITKQIPSIVKETGEILELLVKEFIKIYQQLEKDKMNIDTLTTFFSAECEIWEKTLNTLQVLKAMLDAHRHILDHIQQTIARITSYNCISTATTHEINQDIAKLEGYAEVMSLLETVTNEQLEPNIANLLTPFKKADDFLRSTKGWYEILPTIFDGLSSYRLLKEKKGDDLSNLGKFLQKWTSIDVDLQIDATALHTLLSEILDKEFFLPINNLGPAKVDQLRCLFNIIFEEPTTDTQGDAVRIAGNFIFLSSATPYQTSEIKKLDIYAAYKIFIDCDFKRVGNNFQLSIVSPEWEVVGLKRQINLDGQPGHDNETVAKSGDVPSSKGEDGVAGLPGGNGGYFVGFGNEIINYGSLKISVCGGKGGKGQTGGNGKDGQNGIAANAPENKDIWFWEGDLAPKCDKIETKVKASIGLPFLSREKEINECLVQGQNGGLGGDGGNGGIGGIGGFPGIASFKGIVSSCQPEIIAEFGKRGEAGEGGKGGKGGMHGDGLKFTAEIDRPIFDVFYWRKNLVHSNQRKVERGRATDGVPGKKGGSELNLIKPEQVQSTIHELKILNEYLVWFYNVVQSHPLESRCKKIIKIFKTLLDQ